jgi:GNAT superfamily N-acetyltransferase
MEPIRIERACEDDVEMIVGIRQSAIQVTSRPYYPEETINDWSNPDRCQQGEKFRTALQRKETIAVVAKVKSDIVGFGIINTTRNYLGAMYVAPEWGKKGIGARILLKLEKEATNLSLDFLVLDASLNSQRFYEKNGYETLEKGFHTLQSGARMECFKMRKTLNW